MNANGFFIVFEGADGAGKSTQARALAEHLRGAGHEVVLTREPGGTDISEKLRSLVLEHGQGSVDERTEALIFAAARAAHVAQLIRPSLAAGKVVISDRYVDSSIAYQGVGRGLGVAPVTIVNDFATEQLRPDLTVVIDVEAAESAQRKRRREQSTGEGEDRLESSTARRHEDIRREFLHLAQEHPERYLVFDATLASEELSRAVCAAVDERLATARTAPGMSAEAQGNRELEDREAAAQ